MPVDISRNITSVGYGVTKNLGNFEFLRLDMQAVVCTDELYEEVLDKLRTQVSIDANFRESEYVDLLEKSRQVKLELANLVSEREKLVEEIAKFREFWGSIQSEANSEVQALLSNYFNTCSLPDDDSLGGDYPLDDEIDSPIF